MWKKNTVETAPQIKKNCRIGDNVTIKGGSHLDDTETDNYVIKSGIVVLKKAAVIPKGFTLE